MSSNIVIFLFLLCSSAFFSASETALFSLSAVQLKRFRESRSLSAARIVRLLRVPRKLLVTILLGNELANVSLSMVGAAIVSHLVILNALGQMVAAVAIITPVILVFGEVVPKNVALRSATVLAPIIIWPLGLFYKLVRPFRTFLVWIAERVILLFGGSPERSESMIMEEEYRRLIDLGEKEGVIVEEERALIHNVFEFSDKVTEEIMTPVARLFSLSVDIPYENLLEEMKSVQYSRVPFYSSASAEIVGILHVRDLFAFHRRRQSVAAADIRELLTPPLFVSARTPLEELLKEFQRSRMHMALVRGKGGKVVGVVTMDDVLENLFGEME